MRRLVIRNVEIEHEAGLDVLIEDGVISRVGRGLRAADELDGRGGALLPGLIDHHIHLLALAAEAASLRLERVTSATEFGRCLRDALAERRHGQWLRVLGYHETIAGELDRRSLDALAPHWPVRVQHQTGALWVLNSAALALLPCGDDPGGLDRERGWLWRGDDWLRSRLGGTLPNLAPVGGRLAAYGITGVTDASVSTDKTAARHLAAGHRAGDLPQRLTLMSGGALPADEDGYVVGPLKILLDDHALPDFDDVVERLATARAQGRAAAVHCVTAGELALSLAAFGAVGARPGDRIEHGGIIPDSMIGELRALGLTVVTQPAFVRERGDRYLAEVDSSEHHELYRCASLLAAGVPVAASSDAPYVSADPWIGVATAIDRRTAGGETVAQVERVDAERALGLYLGAADSPGGPPRRVIAGAGADLCLLHIPLAEALTAPDCEMVRNTLIAGRIVHGAV